MRPLMLILTAALAIDFAAGDEYVWLNVREFPDDLTTTRDAWTAARVEDPGFTSFRCAADDFVLTERTRIDRITHYTVEIQSPIILAGDWYIYEGNGNQPGPLIAAGPDREVLHEPIGHDNQSFGTIYRNVVEPVGLTLPPGRYFLAFRTEIAHNGHKHSTLSTRWLNGDTAAYWNFGVLTDGTVTERWQLLEEFNQIPEQEWAFMIEGQTLGSFEVGDLNCDGAVDALDIEPFLIALFEPGEYGIRFPDCDINLADINGDGAIDALDIEGFLELLFP